MIVDTCKFAGVFFAKIASSRRWSLRRRNECHPFFTRPRRNVAKGLQMSEESAPTGDVGVTEAATATAVEASPASTTADSTAAAEQSTTGGETPGPGNPDFIPRSRYNDAARQRDEAAARADAAEAALAKAQAAAQAAVPPQPTAKDLADYLVQSLQPPKDDTPDWVNPEIDPLTGHVYSNAQQIAAAQAAAEEAKAAVAELKAARQAEDEARQQAEFTSRMNTTINGALENSGFPLLQGDGDGARRYREAAFSLVLSDLVENAKTGRAPTPEYIAERAKYHAETVVGGRRQAQQQAAAQTTALMPTQSGTALAPGEKAPVGIAEAVEWYRKQAAAGAFD